MAKQGEGVLAEVLVARRRLRDDPEVTLSRDQVLQWAASEDLEALAAVNSLLFDPEASRRIEPNLTLPEYMSAALPYLERCLREDPKGQWADSRWEAGGLIANWIKDVWTDQRFRPSVDKFRDWLAKLYKSADDPDLRTCLVQTTLEHLFEIDGIAATFGNWQYDPELRPAYEEAKRWQEGFDKLSRLPHQSAASAAAQVAALEQEVVTRLRKGSTKDSVTEFLRSNEIDFFDIPEHRFVAASVRPTERGVVGNVHVLFWFDAHGRLTRYWVGDNLDQALP